MLDLFQGYLNQRSITFRFINDDNTLLTFDINNIHYLFSYRRNADPHYFRIMIPNVDNININDLSILNRLQTLTQSYKIGKAEIQEGQLWLCADSFVYSRDNVNQLFERMLAVLQDMFNEYRRNTNV